MFQTRRAARSPIRWRWSCVPARRVALSLLVLAGWGPAATAQAEQTREFENPPLLEIQRRAAPAMTLMDVPLGAPALADEAVLQLNVRYIDSRIWNPAKKNQKDEKRPGGYDKVKLRGYQGRGVDPNAPYVAPTIEVRPGETVRMTLNNELPADPPCISWPGDVNEPHCFNGTNMHTHGLWVNPSGNGDNVLISINPGVSFQYEYNIPPDHPAGTFWYHPHRHGSTALQVSSGMAGALIIRGDRQPTDSANGDIDVLLKPTERQPFPERILVLQQIQYACRDKAGRIKTDPPSDDEGGWVCEGKKKGKKADVGGIEHYSPFPTEDDPAQFGPGTWQQSGRYTSINGHVLPTFAGAKTGQIERWRVIHAGVRDTINLRFRRHVDQPKSFAGLKASENDTYIEENCPGDPLPYHLIAADGLTMEAALETTVSVFQPGYRWDALVVFEKKGKYCVIDDEAPAAGSVEQAPPSRRLLGIVEVGEGVDVRGDIAKYLTSQLVGAAKSNLPGPVFEKIKKELEDKLKLTSFVPHRDIEESEVDGEQDLVFNIDVTKDPPEFQVNGKPYDPEDEKQVRKLKLGGVDTWTLTSDFVSHPFHIHVNPFQIVEIRDPKGKDVSEPNAVDNGGGTTDPDPQYPGLKGVWKDTLWVKNLVPPGEPPGEYTLIVRTRYQRYIGDFVLHCHILDHEDQGMMQNVRIVLPDGEGGLVAAHE